MRPLSFPKARLPSFRPVGLALVPVVLSLSGCSLSPSLVVFGAAFPDWLFCIVAGVAATTLVHLLSGRWALRERLAPLALSYPALAGLFAMLFWLAVFHS